MLPATSERNFTPSSTGLSGPPSTTPGTALPGQILTVDGVAVVMVMLNGLLAVKLALLASATCTVKLKVPTVVGVPEIAPLVAFSDKPGGSDPDSPEIDHVYGGVPPLAATDDE